MKTVFVVQRPTYFDRASGEVRDKYDLTPAAQFGNIVYLLGPHNIFPDKIEESKETVRRAVTHGYRYPPREELGLGDYLLAVGDPVAIALTMRVIAEEDLPIRILKWDRLSQTYAAFSV